MFERRKSGKSGRRIATHELRRSFADFALVLALFWAVALTVSGSYSRAHAVPLPAIGRQAVLPGAVAAGPAGLRAAAPPYAAQGSHKAQTGQPYALALLSVAFAALFACNLAFWRHLRRVYASPRRSVWRRG